MILLSSSIAFPPFYSVNLGSWGTIDSHVLLPVYQSLLYAHHPEGRAFPCFSFFSSFWFYFFESHGWLFYSGVRLMSCSFWPSFLFVIFPGWVESNSIGSKALCCYFLFFIAPCSGSPRYRSLCIVSGYSRFFSLFLAGFLIPEKDSFALCF